MDGDKMEEVDRLLTQLSGVLSALHRAGLPVSAVTRPAAGRPPLTVIILEDIGLQDGVFYQQVEAGDSIQLEGDQQG